MDNRKQDLSSYRLSQAEDSIKVAQMSYDNALFKDSINRSYYATFYAIKAVLALEEIDFKRHKDAIGYFNKTYVATEKFSKEVGRRIGMLKQLREKSDYDDFYIAGKMMGFSRIAGSPENDCRKNRRLFSRYSLYSAHDVRSSGNLWGRYETAGENSRKKKRHRGSRRRGRSL